MMPVYFAVLVPSVVSGGLAQSTAVSGYARASIGAALLGAWDVWGGAADSAAVLAAGDGVLPAHAPKMTAEIANNATRAERRGTRDMRTVSSTAPGPACSLPCGFAGTHARHHAARR